VAFEVLERGADGVQAPDLGRRGSGPVSLALDEDAFLAAATAVTGWRGRGQEEAGAGGSEDGIAEAVVKVPDPLQGPLRLRRVPPHFAAGARGFFSGRGLGGKRKW
jgi:hypothetical protein